MSKLLARPWNASTEINQLEHRWWEQNADILARVWEMTDPLSLAIRSNYLSRAKNFLLEGRTEAQVLELGCGSGWVGQFLSSPNLRIIGTDFSANQIEIANSNAAKRGVAPWCSYSVQDDKGLPPQLSEVNGVLLHCFLHHLDGAELDTLLKTLVGRSRSGTRYYVHEPAFYVSPPAGSVAENPLAAAYYEVATKLHSSVRESLLQAQVIDLAAKNRFDALASEAEAKNWYLSPKEVPFDVTDFTAQLGTYFRVKNHYWSNIFMIGWAFEVNLITDPKVRQVMETGVIPLLSAVDNFLAQDEGFLRRTLTPPGYAFHVWECEVI